jgi:CheY-like chemotaxis protein
MTKPSDLTLLVVDDDDSLRETLVFEFELKGYKVLSAGSGNEGFKVVQNNQVDLVISDIRMPDGTGIDLLRNIKDRNARMPVIIFITAFSDLSQEEAFEMGVDAVLSKPFDRKVILQTVERALLGSEKRIATLPQQSADGKIEANYESWSVATSSQQLTLGLRGFFSQEVSSAPEPGKLVRFDFSFSKEPSRPIKGIGRVEWKRKAAIGKLHRGCGISIEYLEPESREPILEWIKNYQGRSTIPLS